MSYDLMELCANNYRIKRRMENIILRSNNSHFWVVVISAARSLWRIGARQLALLAGTMVLGASVAYAEITPKDVQLMLKVIGFVTPPLAGTVSIAIVFDPGNGDSKKDAEALKSLLDAAQGGPITPVVKLHAQNDLAGLDAKVVVVMAGVSAATLDSVSTAAQSRKMLTISTDPACPKAGKCVVSVRTAPKVEILFSGTAAQAVGIEFQPTFRMMMTGV